MRSHSTWVAIVLLLDAALETLRSGLIRQWENEYLGEKHARLDRKRYPKDGAAGGYRLVGLQ